MPDRSNFQKKPRKFLRRRRKGQKKFHGVTSSKQVKNVVSHNDKLILPEDDFLLLPRYTKKFGDPNSKENKEKGHKVCRKHGYKGVVVPGDYGEGPWRLQQSVNNALESHEIVAEDNSECSSDQVDNVFGTLKEEREEQHASVAQGLVKVLLASFAEQGEATNVPKKVNKKKLKKKKGLRATGEFSDSSTDSRTKKRALTRNESNASTWSEDPIMSLRLKKRKGLTGGGSKAVGSGGGKVAGSKKSTAGGRGVKGVSVPASGQATEDL